MFRPLLGFAALGLASLVAWKFFWAFLLPVVAIVFGLLLTVLKIAVMVALLYLAYRFFRRMANNGAQAA